MNMKKNLFICLLLVQYLPLAAQYKYEETVTYPAAPGMKAVYHDGHWELQDRQGRKILPYNLAEDPPQFRDGITQIARYVGDHRVRFGFIDTQGREVIPSDLTYVYYWQDDRIVADKDHMGVMDFSGKTIIPFIYEYVIPPMGNAVAAQRKSDGKWGFLDIRTGRQLKAFVYDEVHERSYNAQKGTVEVEQGDETIELNIHTAHPSAVNNNVASGPKAPPRREADPRLYTWKDTKLFYADTVNRLVSIYDKKQKKTLVFGFDEIPEPYFTEDEYSGLIVCVSDGKYGIIDHDGSIAESFIYPVNDDYIIHRGMHYVYFYDKQSTDFWLIQWGIGGKFYGGDLDIKNNH